MSVLGHTNTDAHSVLGCSLCKEMCRDSKAGTDSLSSKEFDIFRCISEGLGSNEISKKLFLSQKTIDNNISIIKKKLNLQSTNQMLHLAIKEGLFLAEY